MKRIIINGGNGYVASNFISELLGRNYEVISLVRERHKFSAEERMKEALSDINGNEYIKPDNLKVYSYSLCDRDFSMPEGHLKDIFNEDVDYFHFAASLKYDLKSKDEIFKTNVEGVENAIKVYLKYAKSNSRFFLIGTAYSCGRFSGLFEEKFYDNEDISMFRNYYEQSKRFAENVVKKYIGDNRINGHIIRLSQVVGNSQSGATKTDYGIFDFAKRVYSLAYRYPDRTIKVCVDPNSTQNLIPINTVIDGLIRIAATDKVPEIINFTAKNPIKNSHIINSINRLLPTNLIPVKYLDSKEMNAIERIIAAGMSFTGNYTDSDILFDTKKRDMIFPVSDNDVTEDTIFRMLKYFIADLACKKQTKTDCCYY
jgi:nucleoside-diphosphate-sugar epimerase